MGSELGPLVGLQRHSGCSHRLGKYLHMCRDAAASSYSHTEVHSHRQEIIHVCTQGCHCLFLQLCRGSFPPAVPGQFLPAVWDVPISLYSSTSCCDRTHDLAGCCLGGIGEHPPISTGSLGPSPSIFRCIAIWVSRASCCAVQICRYPLLVNKCPVSCKSDWERQRDQVTPPCC